MVVIVKAIECVLSKKRSKDNTKLNWKNLGDEEVVTWLGEEKEGQMRGGELGG